MRMYKAVIKPQYIAIYRFYTLTFTLLLIRLMNLDVMFQITSLMLLVFANLGQITIFQMLSFPLMGTI